MARQGTRPQACPGAVETRVNFAGILQARILQITGAYPRQRLYPAISSARRVDALKGAIVEVDP